MHHLVVPVAEVEAYRARIQADAQRDLKDSLSDAGLEDAIERVFSHLTCSVLAIKPEGFQCPIEFPEPAVAQESDAS